MQITIKIKQNKKDCIKEFQNILQLEEFKYPRYGSFISFELAKYDEQNIQKH